MATRLGRFLRFDALFLAAGLWFLAKLLRYAFPPLFDSLQASYGVSNTVIGSAYTGFMLVYAAAQFPSGVLADRFDSVRVIAAGALVAVAGALSLSLEAGFDALVAAMLVMGAGTGVHKTAAVRLLSRIYPARTGRVLGTFDTIGTLSGVVAPVAVLTLASTGGWRAFFVLAGCLGLCLVALFVRRVPARIPDGGPPSESDRSSAELGDYVVLLSDRRFVLFVGVTVAFSFTYNGMVAFLPLYLTDYIGLSSTLAGLLYSALFAASVVQLASGDLSDRIGQLPVIVATLTLAFLSLVALLRASNPVVVGAVVVALGCGCHGFRPVRGAYLMRVIPDAVAGGSFGIVRTALMAAGAVAPAIVGVLSDTVGFGAAFGTLAGSLGLSAAGAAALLVRS